MTGKRIQVLLVEDNPGDARLIREDLADTGATCFNVETVQTLASTLERCSRPGIDAVLLDLGLPDSVGLDTLKAFRSRVPELPVVVLTGLNDEKVALQAIQAGAQDYLVKGKTDAAIITRALRYATERKRAEAELRESESRYREVFAGTPDGIIVHDAEGHILDANDAMAQRLEIQREALLGRQIADFVTPDNAAKINNNAQIALAGQTQIFETTYVSASGKTIPAEVHERRIQWRGGQAVLSISRDITVRKRAEEALKESGRVKSELVERFNDAQHLSMIGSWEWDLQTNHVWWSDETYQIFGVTPQDFVPSFEANGKFIHPDDFALYGKSFEHSFQTGEPLDIDLRLVAKDGRLKHCHAKGKIIYDDSGQPIHFVGTLMDITIHKKADDRVRLANCVLERLNHPGNTTDTIHDILQMVQKHTGIEAVGIRLREGDDFPYYETKGFPEDFLAAERYLCARDAAGKIVRDTHGNPVLECMCGNILCGRTDPRLPFFTEKGSFWTNCTTELLASTTEKDRQARTRNHCNGAGYESVALIPLRSDDEVIGLLQLNDHRRNQFSLEMILFFEGLGASIGITIARKKVTTALRESEARFRELFDHMGSGVAVYEAVDNGGDFIFRDFNPAAEKMEKVSRKDILGRRVSEAFPGVKSFGIFEVFQRVWQTGKPEYVPENIYKDDKNPGGWRENWVFKLPSGEIVAIYNDVTGRKQVEEALQESQEKFRIAQEFSPDGFTILRPVRDAQERVIDFTWVYENAAVARLNGTDPNTVAGRRLLELFPGHRGSSFLKAYQQVAETGEGCIFEDSYQGETIASTIWFRIVVVPMGKDIAILAQDITERKRTETEIAKQLDELRRWQTVTLGREGRVLEMKKEVNELLKRLGEPPRYPSAEAN